PATSRRPATPLPRPSPSRRTDCSRSGLSSPEDCRCRSASAPVSSTPHRSSSFREKPAVTHRLSVGFPIHPCYEPRSRRESIALNNDEGLAGLAELITDETGIDAGDVAL